MKKKLIIGLTILIVMIIALILIFTLDTEPIVGAGCGVVSPDSRDECCINEGYDYYNLETYECGYNLITD